MPEPISRDEELRRLRQFLEHLQSLLASVVDRPLNIIPGRHHESMRAAWYELLPNFEALSGAINANARPQLERVGLVGLKLQFEIGVFEHARSELLDHAPEIFVSEPSPAGASPGLRSPQTPPKEWGWWRRLRSLLSKCLKSADVVLGSLAKVFAQADIIKQFKEGVEAAIGLSTVRKP